ncbi:hypothetical protein PENARI_c001G05119 [Penicillium arizonense]|uniref:Uncharacterized protein n=1 Tax=Penicillium arizonense TaxID=1835702 RepID=A0A1F5LZ29_PENAI|nr:hypothetical protein PENARI_c001G05119 [Penicillium arizonense]OGE58181.1 hypothetical protein PENARI_c001G05119 [Penicillium arizonense]
MDVDGSCTNVALEAAAVGSVFSGPFFHINASKGVHPPVRRSFGFLATLADRWQAH